MFSMSLILMCIFIYMFEYKSWCIVYFIQKVNEITINLNSILNLLSSKKIGLIFRNIYAVS